LPVEETERKGPKERKVKTAKAPEKVKKANNAVMKRQTAIANAKRKRTRVEMECLEKKTGSLKNNEKRKPARRTNDRNERKKKRTFLTAVMRRVCLLCEFCWKNEEELREHRLARHPNRSLQDLMTVISVANAKEADDSDFDSDNDDDLFVECRVPQKDAFNGPSAIEVPPGCRPFIILLEQIPMYRLSKRRHFFACNECDYFCSLRKYLVTHMKVKHAETHRYGDLAQMG
jgi:hypothetical protein